MKVGIVGCGLGGLLIGGLLAKDGFSVKIYEQLPFIGGRFTHFDYDGFKLTTGALHMIPHGSRGYLANILKKVGANVNIVDSNPDGTFLINGKEYLYNELFSILNAKDKLKAINLATKLKLKNVNKNISFGEFLEDIDLALKIGRAFTGWSLSLSPYDVPLSEILNIMDNYHKFGGPGIPIGGCKKVIDELERIILNSGGEIVKEYEVKSIEIEEDKGYIDDEEFDIVISNISPQKTQEICNIKFLNKDVEPAGGIKINIATKKGIIKHGGVLFTPECERVNGLNQVTNVDKSLAPEGWHLVMTHQALLSKNIKKEIDLGLEDIERLFKDIDYKILLIQSYFDGWPVNYVKSGISINNIISDRFYLVGDGAKPSGGIEVEGIAMGVLKVYNHIVKKYGKN
ncbi:NAD(P)-binding protein [Methanocaldococcus indicus]|uniref:NAD(P)-binding protein n=1 Tax=Methanocaldococcus indicus TaxID=213231 RepID=UPI003C6CEAD9